METKTNLKKMWERSRRDLASGIFWSTATAIAAGPIMSIWTYLNGMPLPFVVFLGVSMSAAVFLLSNEWQRWRYRNSPEGKLHYDRMNVQALRAGEKNGVVGWIAKVGFDITNTAEFPIEYKIVRLWTAIDGQATKEHNPPNNGAILNPKESSYYFDGEIVIGTLDKARYQCELDYEFLYGRPGDLRYTQTRRVRGYVAIESDKGIVDLVAYTVAPPA